MSCISTPKAIHGSAAARDKVLFLTSTLSGFYVLLLYLMSAWVDPNIGFPKGSGMYERNGRMGKKGGAYELRTRWKHEGYGEPGRDPFTSPIHPSPRGKENLK